MKVFVRESKKVVIVERDGDLLVVVEDRQGVEAAVEVGVVEAAGHVKIGNTTWGLKLVNCTNI